MIKRVQNIFQQSPKKSIRRASHELQMSSTNVWQVVRKHLHIIPYKLHLLQHLKDTNKPACKDFCTQMQAMQAMLEGFDDHLVFSDKATFHLTGKVNKHNTHIWGTEHSMLEHAQDSPKMNMLCAIS